MTPRPLSVGPDESVVYAAKLMFENDFPGLPVVDERNVVIGIVTEYDLISRNDILHLPTLINVLSNIEAYRKDSSLIKDDLKKLLILRVRDVMNSDPLLIEENSPIQLAAELFAHHHRVNPIPVVDANGKLTGIVSRFDLVKFFVDKDVEPRVEFHHPEMLDKKVEGFIKNFEDNFLMISKQRVKIAKFWPTVTLFFALFGFALMSVLILQLIIKL